MGKVIDINSYREKKEKAINKGKIVDVSCYREGNNKKVIDINTYREKKKKVPNIYITLKLNNDEAQILIDELVDLTEAMHGEKVADALIELLLQSEEDSFMVDTENLMSKASESELYTDSLFVLENQMDYLEELLIYTERNYVLMDLHLYEFHYLIPALASGIEIAENDKDIQKAIILQEILISCNELVLEYEKEFFYFYEKYKTTEEKIQALSEVL